MILSLAATVELLGGAVTARQRVRGEPAWFCPELVETEDARARLHAWAVEGGFTRAPTVVREQLQYFGDEAIWPVVLDAFRRLPPPVADFLVAEFVVLGVGWESNGWILRAVLPSRPAILLAGADRDAARLGETMLHEAAHAWLEPLLAGAAPPYAPAAGPAALLDAATAVDMREPLLSKRQARERRAEALAWRWLRP